MDPVFPLTKSPILNGKSRGLEDNILRTENDTGPPELRRVSSQLLETFDLSYIITDAERDTLLAWFRTDIAQGAKRFEIPIDGVTFRAQLRGSPSLTPAGAGGWRVNIQILTLGEVI